MYSFLNQLSLNRYLIVWRVNSSLVFFPRYLSLDLSLVIGTIILRRLPTSQISPWRKALTPLIEHQKKVSKHPLNQNVSVPESSWPIKSTILVYPGKLTYGRDELIFWELKLFGEHADHGLFLEIILPAMEEASSTSEPEWNQRNRLWGHFDIEGIYMARGHQWEPIVEDGRLDLRYKANPAQWLEGLRFKPKTQHIFRKIVWLTPFEFSRISAVPNQASLPENMPVLAEGNVPTLSGILSHLISRMKELRSSRDNDFELLDEADQTAFQEALHQASKCKSGTHQLQQVSRKCPGKWKGTQHFLFIHPSIIPYLEAASILHIGKQTHFGCGTFVIV